MEDRRTSTTRGDNAAWLNLLVTVVAALMVLARTLEVAGCDSSCDYHVLETATRAFWSIDFVAFVLTSAAYFVMRSRRRHAWVLPVSGITITLIALVVTNVVMNGAFGTR